MSDFKAYFNKHDLSELFTISPPVRTLTPWEPTSVEAVIGATPTGTKAQPMEIKLTLTTFAETVEQRLSDLRTLRKWLAVDEPKSLVLTDEVVAQVLVSGEYVDEYEMHYAWPSGAPKITPSQNAMTAEVTFICPDPQAYQTNYQWSPAVRNDKKTWSLVLSPDGHAETVIRGTAPTKPQFTLYGVHGFNTDVPFNLFVSTSATEELPYQYHYISIPAAPDASLTVDLNFETRTLTIGGTPVMDMDLEWFDLPAGSTCTVYAANGGFKSGFMRYYPRWW